ncbi:MAG: NFACT RNA binding domain-containing protein [Pseudanabaenaceae cyanobacterium]
MQPFDFTTAVAVAAEVRSRLPGRVEQVLQPDRYTLVLLLRTFTGKQGLTLSWHPQGARFGWSGVPPRRADTFAFRQQVGHQVQGLVLGTVGPAAPWERVLRLEFAERPGETPQWCLYLEIVGQYSNAVLVNGEGLVVAAARQVGDRQSRLRSVQTGEPYQLPPPRLAANPDPTEPLPRWRDRLTVLGLPLGKGTVAAYRGVSTALAQELWTRAGLAPSTDPQTLTAADWERGFAVWQQWLQAIAGEALSLRETATGYGLAWEGAGESPSAVVARYYETRLQGEADRRLVQQLRQVIQGQQTKLQRKAEDFRARLARSATADTLRTDADLLMSHLHLWQPGLTAITLPDFATGEPRTLTLDPAATGLQNAQAWYRQYQKRRRSGDVLAPLLAEVMAEIAYLEQVATTLELGVNEAEILREIEAELVEQRYLTAPGRPKTKPKAVPSCRRYTSPNGWEVWVGRNNRQNDWLWREAQAWDIWLHAQEIPGSHVLLRLAPQTAPDLQDLQYAANLAAYYSRARLSDRVPVVWVRPQHLFKPKGAKPGMVAYRNEQVLWGEPATVAPDPLC